MRGTCGQSVARLKGLQLQAGVKGASPTATKMCRSPKIISPLRQSLMMCKIRTNLSLGDLLLSGHLRPVSRAS